MPRLVFWPTPSRVAATAASIRAPTGVPAAARWGAERTALASKSATLIRCPAAWTWTLPGLIAASSARQAAR